MLFRSQGGYSLAALPALPSGWLRRRFRPLWGGKRSWRRYHMRMLHTRDLAGVVEVDGLKYVWEVQREPQWCTADGYRGLTILLRQMDSQREALIEFPMPMRYRGKRPNWKRPQVNDAIVINGVRAALLAGWEPTSRGKTMTFVVDASGR